VLRTAVPRLAVTAPRTVSPVVLDFV